MDHLKIEAKPNRLNDLKRDLFTVIRRPFGVNTNEGKRAHESKPKVCFRD